MRWSWWALAILCGVADVSVSADLSPQARLGRRLFFDPSLSASGALSCASCHDPNNAYAAPASTPVVMNGGPKLDQPGARAVPSLRYLAQTPRFARHLYLDSGAEREDIGPAGGLMLDGRVDGLQEQALLPLLDPREMANRTVEDLGRRLRGVAYLGEFQTAFDELSTRAQALTLQAAQALARFEAEDPSFRPYDSRFDRYLRGAQTLSPQEISGLKLFLDPAKGNCAACHTASIGPGGRAPDFTDYSFHALGVPRNPAIPANRDPAYFDLGLCGPRRTDLRNEAEYCGYFKTPTLRNVARRAFFFHNGRFTSLEDVLRFYVQRDIAPRRWYPAVAGRTRKFDDLPNRFVRNVDSADPPFNRGPGDTPALSEKEIGDVIAFLRTLSDAH